MKKVMKSAAVVVLTAILTAGNVLGAGIPVSAAAYEAVSETEIVEEEDSLDEDEFLIEESVIEDLDSEDSNTDLVIEDENVAEAASAVESPEEELTAQVHTVTFQVYEYEDKNGNTQYKQFPEQKVEHGKYAKEPDTTGCIDYEYYSPAWRYFPTARGGSFFDSKNFDFNTMPITEDITIILARAARYIKVTFDPQNGLKPKTMDVIKGRTLMYAKSYEIYFDIYGLKKEGYTLAGWALTSDATEPLPNDTLFTDGMYLYAVWVPDDQAPINWGDITEDIRKAKNLTSVPTGLWHYNPTGTTYTYTGKAIVPTGLKVFYQNKLLKENTDYELTVANNVNAAGPDSAKAPTYTITLKGNYKGKADPEITKLTIAPFSFEKNKSSISCEKEVYLSYNKKLQKYKPKVAVNLDGSTVNLKENKDYTLEYNDTSATGTPYLDPGDYKVTVRGKGNYDGVFFVTEHITAAKLMSKAKVTGIKALTYNSSALTQDKMVVSLAGKPLVKDRDYRVQYSDNKLAGTAQITITGVPESGFVGTKTVKFTIKKRAIKGAETVNPITPVNVFRAPAVTFKVDRMTLPIAETGTTHTLKGCENSAYEALSDSEKAAVDYTFKYVNNTTAGKAKIVFKGVGNFSGTLPRPLP